MALAAGVEGVDETGEGGEAAQHLLIVERAGVTQLCNVVRRQVGRIGVRRGAKEQKPLRPCGVPVAQPAVVNPFCRSRPLSTCQA